jgi:hypothetical protein
MIGRKRAAKERGGRIPRRVSSSTELLQYRGTLLYLVEQGGAAAAVAGRTAYREEYQRDYGPDLDESLDGIESGHEF